MKHIYQRLIDEGGSVKPNDPSRTLNLRFSGLPFCAIKFFLDLRTNLSNGAWKPYHFHYYTSVGTAVHSSIQKSLIDLPTEETHLADWKCRQCSTLTKLAPRPTICSACGGNQHKFMEHEITLEFGPGFSKVVGHVDTIYETQDKAHWVVDWKTTSTKSIDKAAKYPSPGYISQLTSYASVLTEFSGLNVTKLFLGFIPRDSPDLVQFWSQSLTEEAKQTSLENLRRWSSDHYSMLRISSLKDLSPFVASRPCKDKQPKEFCYCKYTNICAKSPDASSLKPFLRKTLDFLKSGDKYPYV